MFDYSTTEARVMFDPLVKTTTDRKGESYV